MTGQDDNTLADEVINTLLQHGLGGPSLWRAGWRWGL